PSMMQHSLPRNPSIWTMQGMVRQFECCRQNFQSRTAHRNHRKVFLRPPLSFRRHSPPLCYGSEIPSTILFRLLLLLCRFRTSSTGYPLTFSNDVPQFLQICFPYLTLASAVTRVLPIIHPSC